MNKMKSSFVGILVTTEPFAYIVSFFSTLFMEAGLILLIMVLFVFADLFTGIWKSINLNGIKSINSSGIRRTIEKLVGYGLLILLGLIFDKAILSLEWFSLIKIFSGVILLAELISIGENLTSITGNKIFVEIVKLAKKIFSSKVDSVINEIGKEKDENVEIKG